MRTTIEIRDDLRARLLALAARRGMRGLSAIVEEALERYLAREAARRSRVAEALAAIGSLSPSNAAAMHERVRALRRRWRA